MQPGSALALLTGMLHGREKLGWESVCRKIGKEDSGCPGLPHWPLEWQPCSRRLRRKSAFGAWRKLRLGPGQTFSSWSNSLPELCTRRRGRKLVLSVRPVNCGGLSSSHVAAQRKGFHLQVQIRHVISRERAGIAPLLCVVQTMPRGWAIFRTGEGKRGNCF